MSRLAGCFETLADQGRTALTTFITAGDPDLDATVPALHAMVAAGADILELGVPFSDPEAEGPEIQAAFERALANGVTLSGCLSMVRAFRAEDESTPIVLMGYLNSVLAMGVEVFARAAADAGVDGLIMVNLPPEEADPLKSALDAAGLDLIFLASPTSTDQRLRKIVGRASGFIYYVSLKGITGADHLQTEPVARRVADIKALTDTPVQVGFGIKDADSARALAEAADGVVVGSALVSIMLAEPDPGQRLHRLAVKVAELRQALDG